MKILTIIVISMLISACSSGGKIADKTYYRFPEAKQFSVEKNYIIEKPTAMSILGNRPMVAQDSNGGLIQMSHNLWLESPKILLQSYLQSVFFQSNNKDQVYTLKTHILSLEKKAQTAILTIEFNLVDQELNNVFSKTYKLEGTLENNSIPYFVKSISQSLHQMIQMLVKDLP